MTTAIASQLHAIKSLIQADSEPLKRPFTRPSIIFDPKEAADIDIDTILSIALTGLEVLVDIDERYRNYKHDLFSHKSRELERELMGVEENNSLNASINSYMRLLSGHFQLPAALKTLEYLIRRYKVHVFNVEELVLCALPYHDTHSFVRVMQLLDPGNSKWRFLNGVKTSGAPPPRQVIVRQCICDMAILETLCNYASASKKFQPPGQVISFCTAVIVEVLGSIATVESDLAKRILPFVITGLQPVRKGRQDHKAGALMVVGLLANKVALSPKLVKCLIRTIAEFLREDSKELADLQWLRLSVMAFISLVQLQSVDVFPKKAVDVLKEIRDLAGVLFELTKEFNIDKFLSLLLESLVEYSSDQQCNHALISILEKVPVKNCVEHLVLKMLLLCMRLSERISQPEMFESGNYIKHILITIKKKYPSELCLAVHKFFEDPKVQSKKEGSVFEIVCKILDEHSNLSMAASDSRIWFMLNHPRADIRRATLSGLSTSSILKTKAVDSLRFITIQDALLHQLRDGDLSVVQAALSFDELSEILNSVDLLKALHEVLERSALIITSGASPDTTLAADVALSCLDHAFTCFSNQNNSLRKIATMIFPFLLILPKSQRLNLRALEIATKLKWPFYQNLAGAPSAEKKLDRGSLLSINLDTLSCLALTFSKQPKEYISWLRECCNNCELSRTLFLLVMLQAVVIGKNGFTEDTTQFPTFFEVCFPLLKAEWEAFESPGSSFLVEKFDVKMLNWDSKGLLDWLFEASLKVSHSNILICIFWRLIELFISTMSSDHLLNGAAVPLDDNCSWPCAFHNLFVFFTGSRFVCVFKEHIHYLISNCKIYSVHFLSRCFTEEDFSSTAQLESLHCFSYLCSQSENALCPELIAEFPALLVPLSCENQDIRIAAMSCIEGLHALLSRADFPSRKNGNIAVVNHFFVDIWSLMQQQKRLILSDKNFLSSFFTSLLGGSSCSFLVPENIGARFDQPTKEEILGFILNCALKLSSYGKLKIFSMLKGVGSALMLVKDVGILLTELLMRRKKRHLLLGESCPKLSRTEIDILCLLLESCAVPSSYPGYFFEDYLMKALLVDGAPSEDPAVIQPCTTVLKKLDAPLYSSLNTGGQEQLFHVLVILHRHANSDVQNASKEALLRLNISYSTVCQMLNCILDKKKISLGLSSCGKKKRKKTRHQILDPHAVICEGTDASSFLVSFLDVLLLKKDIVNREYIIGLLFKLLRKLFLEDWFYESAVMDEKQTEFSQDVSETISGTTRYIKQTTLLVLDDICSSLIVAPAEDGILNEIDTKLLVECARSSMDGVTRNHIFLLLTSIAKVSPEKVLNHLLDIICIMGQSAVTQIDSHSQCVFEGLISAIVPYWLSKTENKDKLLQVFVDVLPEIAEHRRLAIMMHLLRMLGEGGGLASLVDLLLRSLVSRKGSSYLHGCVHSWGSVVYTLYTEWEYEFATQICGRYSCDIWLSSLVLLVQRIAVGDLCQELFIQLLLAMQFILHKLQDAELEFQLELCHGSDKIQATLGELMEHLVSVFVVTGSRREQSSSLPVVLRKELKHCMRVVLNRIMQSLLPSAYFKSTLKLLGYADKNVKKKALVYLCETLRDSSSRRHNGRKKQISDSNTCLLEGDDSATKALDEICLEIIRLIDDSIDDKHTSLKLAAVSALEVLAKSSPSNYSIISRSLASVTKKINSENMSVSSCCLRAAGTFIHVLGPRALSGLPHVMENALKRFHNIPCVASETKLPSSKNALVVSTLVTLEAVIDKLGGFTSPYLHDILKLLILHPDCTLGSDQKVKLQADAVRKLAVEKIPVRLVLPSLLDLYSGAVKTGDVSLPMYFEMLTNLVGSMDRSSINGYHAKIFDLCLQALDLRRQCITTVQNINHVETCVINALTTLTMKLTETMFKPLFLKTIEWAESDIEPSTPNMNANLQRLISFYNLVHNLAEKHRSLFVPYLKYLLEGCVRYLTDSENGKDDDGLTRKKKKAKLQESINGEKRHMELSPGKWHLRALILSSLHKCFLYDNGSLNFVDSSNFQLLLRPVVSQLVVEPPISVQEEQLPSGDTPSVKEVDDLLVACVGQFAIAAGSDLLWKPLNHEVLMQSRSEKVRSRVLALRIVKSLVENLKEEYLVLLPETIPFLAELLEDVEQPVKSLAQEILKEMESLSGESLSQYL